MNAVMKVKITVNGNSFYYGRLMADYMPLSAYNTVGDTLTNIYYAIPASQRLKLYIDPSTSQAGTIECPCIIPLTALSITRGDWGTYGGLISIRELAALKHANAATTPVEIVVWAWAEEVKLAVPTTVNMDGLVSQSGNEPLRVDPITNIATTNNTNSTTRGPNSPINAAPVEVTCCVCGAKKKPRSFPVSKSELECV
jgi:hypothetical protein